MNQYNSYYLYQQYEKRGSQDWLPCYPNIFSVDGDGTMPLVMKKENDPDCGYTGDTQPIYRWYPLPITTDYICDECPVVQYRWENISITEDYVCVGTDKYYKQKRQYSYDSGTTWYDVTPPETQTGSLYQTGSTDCGYVPPIEPQYRTTSGTPYCEGYDKYVEVYSQVSYDGGITWSTTATTPTLIEANSQDCGYVPPAPFDGKIRLSYSNGDVYTESCDSSTSITTSNTKPTGYTYSAITSAEIGSCVTSIGQSAFSNCTSLTGITIPDSVVTIGKWIFAGCAAMITCTIGNGVTGIDTEAFSGCTAMTTCIIGNSVASIGSYALSGCTSLTSITIPDSVTSIGQSAFRNCTSLTSCTIGSGVTSIGYHAFRNCSELTSVTVNATTPPGLGGYAFDGSTCPIYVPSGSVNTYKSASGWSTYASRIQAIP